jgi:hypothetical protein
LNFTPTLLLPRDLPEHQLCRVAVVKIVNHHSSPDGENGYSIEVFNALATQSPLPPSQNPLWNYYKRTKF